MATYVAFNVQNFPDSSTAGDSILAVRADLSDSVAGGLSITAFTGVASVSVQALGAHQSASGTGFEHHDRRCRLHFSERGFARLHDDPVERAGRTRPAGWVYQLCAIR